MGFDNRERSNLSCTKSNVAVLFPTAVARPRICGGVRDWDGVKCQRPSGRWCIEVFKISCSNLTGHITGVPDYVTLLYGKDVH